MNRFSLAFLFITLATISSGRYLPEPEFIKKTPKEWTETAHKLGWSEMKTEAIVDLMNFIRNNGTTSAEMNANEEFIDEWIESVMHNCVVFYWTNIEELDENVGDKKWSDVKKGNFSSKWQYWNDKYSKWDNEENKMKVLKNMCILAIESYGKKKAMEYAKSSGLKEEQLKPTADMLWNMRSQSEGVQQSILADHCEMLNGDGLILHTEDSKLETMWSEIADKNVSTKMAFWWNHRAGRTVYIKAVKNICVLFMNAEERKKIEGWAKEAGIVDDEIKTAVDMEMRMQMVTKIRERENMMMKNLDKFAKNNYMLEPLMTEEEREKLKSLENKDFHETAQFWTEKYNNSTGADHIKALKNIFVTVWNGMRKEENSA